MGNVTKLPAVKAREYVEGKLNDERSVEWAINYHRKQRLIINEELDRGNFCTVYDGDICLKMSLCIDLEFEQAMRALIKRVKELEAVNESI